MTVDQTGTAHLEVRLAAPHAKMGMLGQNIAVKALEDLLNRVQNGQSQVALRDLTRLSDTSVKVPGLALHAAGVSVEDPERVHLKDIFGTVWVPKEAASVVRDAVQKMVKAGDIGQTNRWQALEYWAAEYLQQ